MGVFLTSGVTRASLKEKAFFNSHVDAISSLLNGARLWDDGGSEVMQKFGIYIKQNWLIVVTNTQLVERWVKDSNECTHSGKDGHIVSLIAVYRSATVFEYNTKQSN